MPYRRRISESRVRGNRMHGLMREGRGNPVLYSTPDYFHKSELSLNYLIIPEFSFVNVPARQCEFTLTMFFPILELPCILLSIGICVFPLTMWYSVLPFPNILLSFRRCASSFTMWFLIFCFSNIFHGIVFPSVL